MINDELLKYKIGISLLPKVGNITAKKLIAYCGGIEAVFKQKKKALLKIPGVGEHLATNLTSINVIDRALEEIDYISQNNITPYFYLDEDYPQRLKQCEDSPIMLYVKGNAGLNQKKILSIVGTRNASVYGVDFCNALIADLAEKNHDIVIVSGLAYGIDIAAHKAALKHDLLTFAVFAHGLDKVYPSLHKEVAKKIIGKGALITEYITNGRMDRQHFLQRNRIIAGLADATIVIESAEKGGSLVTAEIANSYNRDVFAVPGRVTDKNSVGCNNLIRTNRACLLNSYADIEYIMGWNMGKPKEKVVQRKLFVELSDDEERIINILRKKDKQAIDVLSLELGMPVSKVSSLLLNLEFSGLVRCYPGKVYEAC